MVSTLASVLDDFTQSWDRGECPRAEQYVGLLHSEDSADLIYHEFCLADASDLHPDPADYLRRFPEYAGPLGRLFSLHHAITPSILRDWCGPAAELPSAGDEIGPYRLLRELGRGAFARVFLAEQADLDDRLVVLKIATRPTSEPRLLARASHAHIVEVLRHAVSDDGALHMVFMPFLGGATLSAVLDVRRQLRRRGRSGLDLLADLDRCSAPEYPPANLTRPAREILAGMSYPKALAWIVVRLAEAVDHAYVQGVAHGDLKPSNVLLTAEGIPMLFDFNLAVDWQGAEPGESPADLGGTLAYMAPERLWMIAGRGRGPASKAADLHRADLYALGLLLLEAITGQAPEIPKARSIEPRDLAEALARSRRTLPEPLLGRGHRWISPSLRSILSRCLAPDPADRYARGKELAEDLDRWRTDRPLAFAEEPRRSRLPRLVRRRRSPLIALGLTVVAVATVAIGSLIAFRESKSDQALTIYSRIVDRADSHAFGMKRFGHWRSDESGDPVEATANHLALYNVLKDPDWRDRDDVRALPDRERGELEAWLFEQILRHAVALSQRPDSPEDWRRGLVLLEQTLARSASTPIQAERLLLRDRLGLSDPGPIPREIPRLPQWMDDYLTGVAAEPLHAREALGHYTNALRDRPEMFWAHYRAAVVAFRINEYPIAETHLRYCVSRSPENPILRLLHASSIYYAERDTPDRYRLRPFADALNECNIALELDPNSVPAHRLRALLRKDSGQVEGVRADINRVSMLTRWQGLAPALRIQLGLKLHPGPNYDFQSRETIEDLARQAVKNDPGDHDSRAILATVIGLDDRPAEAIAEYDRVLDADPDHLRARFQRARQLHRLDPSAEIAEYAALIDHPRFEELFREEPSAIRAFHYLATNLLRRGKVAEALEVAHRGLVHANRSRSLQNETLRARRKASKQIELSPRGESHYLLARIHAVASKTDGGELDQAIKYLDLAFSSNEKFRDGWYATDDIFDGLRAEIWSRTNSRAAVNR